MEKDIPSILFLSSSTNIFDIIPEQSREKWNFRLVHIAPGNSFFAQLVRADLIILDTYNMGLYFLDLIKHMSDIENCPILVIDEYEEGVLVDKIKEKGASDYLHIDNFGEGLEEKIDSLITNPPLASVLLT